MANNTNVFYDPEAGMRGFKFGVELVKNFRETADLVRKRAEAEAVRAKMAKHAEEELELAKEQKLREAQIDEQRALLAARSDAGSLVKLKELEAKSAAFLGGLLDRQMQLGNELIQMGTESSQAAGQPLVDRVVGIMEKGTIATKQAQLENELAENERKFKGAQAEADRKLRASEGEKDRALQSRRVDLEEDKFAFEIDQFDKLMEHRAAELGFNYAQLDQRIREMSVETAHKLATVRSAGLKDRLDALFDYQKATDPKIKALILATADFSEDEIDLLTEETVEEVRKSAQEIAQEIAKEQKFIQMGSGDKDYLQELQTQARELRDSERKATRLRMSQMRGRNQNTGKNPFADVVGTGKASQPMAGRGQEPRDYTQGTVPPLTGRK